MSFLLWTVLPAAVVGIGAWLLGNANGYEEGYDIGHRRGEEWGIEKEEARWQKKAVEWGFGTWKLDADTGRVWFTLIPSKEQTP